jgi:L-threonylcarbamoyladenylate synthase
VSLPDPLGEALRQVASGGLLAYPTETLWALGADSRSQPALARLRGWKGRGANAPVSVLVADADHAQAEGLLLEGAAPRLAQAFWPGPLMLVVRSSGDFADGVANREGAVGVRCSSHPLAGALSRLLRREGCGPLTATSLNRSGDPPAASRTQAGALCGAAQDEPRLIDVAGAEAGGGEPSTVIDVTCDPPRLLRWGVIAARDLSPVIGEWSEA